MNHRQPMRIVILGESSGWHVRDLGRSASAKGHHVSLVSWSSLMAEVSQAGLRAGPDSLEVAQAIVVRSMPSGTLEEVIFRMDLLGHLAQRGQIVVNSPRGLEIAIDKYLSLLRLHHEGLLIPRTLVAQDSDSIRSAWNQLQGDAVFKPLFGSCGRGIERIESIQSLNTFLEGSERRGVAYLQEFVPHHGWDVRLLVIGSRVVAMRRISDHDWRTNVARGARAEPFDPPIEWIEIAIRAAKACNTEIAGVDLLPAKDGRVLVLEVNAVPGWRALAKACNLDIAAEVVNYIEDRATSVQNEH